MLDDPIIKGLIPKVFRMIVIIKDFLNQWESLFFYVIYFRIDTNFKLLFFALNKVHEVIIVITIFVFFCKY